MSTTATVKKQAVTMTAGQLKLSEAQVSNVIDEYEKNRSRVRRADVVGSAGVVALGGGWYEVAGEKYQGKAEAENAAADLVNGE